LGKVLTKDKIERRSVYRLDEDGWRVPTRMIYLKKGDVFVLTEPGGAPVAGSPFRALKNARYGVRHGGVAEVAAEPCAYLDRGRKRPARRKARR
jgi:hypothetical protein